MGCGYSRCCDDPHDYYSCSNGYRPIYPDPVAYQSINGALRYYDCQGYGPPSQYHPSTQQGPPPEWAYPQHQYPVYRKTKRQRDNENAGALAATSNILLASAAPAFSSRSTSKLQWGPCQSTNTTVTAGLQCATLPVPLDYQDEQCNQTLYLNLARSPAEGQSKGTILVNFGGPGLDGRNNLVSSNGVPVLGLSEYDWVTWDPRGTGTTLPANCYSDTAVSTNASAAIPFPQNATVPEISKAWDAVTNITSTCKDTLGVNGTLIGSAYTARDMLQIVDALGEDGLLRYYGMSYGSALGQIFAAMFPDRVGRIVIDGVLNPHQYITGTDYQQLATTDAVLDNFFSSCEARPEICNLTMLDTSQQSLRQQFNNKLDKLQKDGPDASFSPLLRYETLVSSVLATLKSHARWPQTATLLYAILSDNKALYTKLSSASAESASGTPQAFPGVSANSFGEITSAIRCSDVLTRIPDPAADVELAKPFFPQSRFEGGLLVAETHIPCMLWPFKAKEQYTGNFDVKTKNPILVVSNIYDPITSLDAALNASATFHGSGLLVQDWYGHVSTTGVSKCMASHLRDYFANGTLPERGTVCEADIPAFYIEEELLAAAKSVLSG
ncbi:hypothetical protein M409DRAFT_26965 [Zasmidium cellare ATCC 36951]|uniref:AB hydrolase-1 domain-containing protein n=1 Tax=Zasmidium cellare ATCC 36951 TaxID=1080233 RepID=A0A6A6C8Z8_ZASCE|nr:uncharacterized protein M409DRAFT_26965 [Zasmidium cellare ATCC 36951]KAF2162728.1 hypothetical protein M409DRAFT_26965 [Zasmidium cellare ATCC 36951]